MKITLFLIVLFLTGYIKAQGEDDFWKQTNGPYGAFALSLTCDQIGMIYVGTMMQGLYKSTDDGFSWSGIGLSGKTINTVLAYTNNIIFAGTDDGLYQTSDGGNNWTKNEIITGVNTLYKTQNGFILSGTQYTIFRSMDMGITWENTMGSSLDVSVKAFSSDATGRLYSAAGNKGVYVSTNDRLSLHGASSNSGLPLTGNSVNIIFAKDSQNVFVYLSSENNSNPESGVYISTNQGLNWTQTYN